MIFDPEEARKENRYILSQYSPYQLGFALVSSVNQHSASLLVTQEHHDLRVTGKKSLNLVSATSESVIHGFHVCTGSDAGNSLSHTRVRLTEQLLNSGNQRGHFLPFCKVTVLVEHHQIRENLWMLDFVQLESWLVGPSYSQPEAKPQKGSSGVLLAPGDLL